MHVDIGSPNSRFKQFDTFLPKENHKIEDLDTHDLIAVETD